MSDINPNSPALSPLQAPTDFAKGVRAMVNETASSRLSLVSEWICDDGEPDASVAGWGLADPHDGTVQVTSAAERRFVFAQSAERAALLVGKITGGPVRVEWVDPAPVIA
jgi:hypothetical protein